MSPNAVKLSSSKQKHQFSSDFFALSRCKIVGISGLVLYLVYLFHFKQSISPPSQPNSRDSQSSTNITHIVFGLVSSVKTWKARRPYVESWWRPNITRGYLILDEPPGKDLLPWPPTSPPLRISDNYTKLEKDSKHVAPNMIRMVLALSETFREGDEGVRWYVMAFDDSILFVDNWVDVLAKYDHNKYFYIGGQAETILEDMFFSFEMGFGGAGIALSYPLAAAMVKDLKGCIRRYPYVHSADLITQFCVDEFGVSLTIEKGIHQIDLKGDISGFLSAHPQAPLLSLHHFDYIDPIFPSMDNIQSTIHLMNAGNVDQSRLLQQTFCYHNQRNWSFSISWGYSAHIYERRFPPTLLKRPLETFQPWLKNITPPMFMFNTRWPCEIPNVFYLDSIGRSSRNEILTTYIRSSPPREPNCPWKGNHFAKDISEIQVLSSASKLTEMERRECCDIVHEGGKSIAEVKLRTCRDDEITG